MSEYAEMVQASNFGLLFVMGTFEDVGDLEGACLKMHSPEVPECLAISPSCMVNQVHSF